jgi:hypothetical protein
MTTETVSGRASQFVAWTAVVLPIAAWTVHMVALASLVELACERPGFEWVMHGLTVGLALVCLACLGIGLRGARLPNGEEAGSTTASIRFLSHVAIAVAIFNFVLIVFEGVYVVAIDACSKAGVH